MRPVVGVRWTVGEASPGTLEQLERSIRSVAVAFAGAAHLAVCVHSTPVASIRDGLRLPARVSVAWLQVDHDLPVFVRRRLDLSAAGGLAWRFAPLRVFSGCCELLVAPGFLVESVAPAVSRWAARPGQRRCLIAHDGAGIVLRGVPPSFDLEDALEAVLSRGPDLIRSERDLTAAELATLSAGAAPAVLRARPPPRSSTATGSHP